MRATADTLLLNAQVCAGASARSGLSDFDRRDCPAAGVSQSSGETPFDRYMEQKNNHTENSICSGC